MAFKMKGTPMYRNFGVGDPKKKGDKGNGVDFSYTQSPKQKAQQDLDMMAAGSRFHPDGTRKKGEDKKMAKMTRKWTGLDQQKYDREAKRESNKFTRKYGEGQEGIDKFKNKQRKKNKRKKFIAKINPFDAESKKARATRSTARKNRRREGESGKGVGKNCTEKGCGAYR